MDTNNETTTRICKVCQLEKDLSQYAPHLMSCKKCQYNKTQDYHKQYYKAHQEKIKNYNNCKYMLRKSYESVTGEAYINKSSFRDLTVEQRTKMYEQFMNDI